MTLKDNSEFENNSAEEEKINSNIKGNQFCPYLGLKFDPKSWVGYASPINYCHRVKPLAAPNLDHQRIFCLTHEYIDCPIILGGSGQRMPTSIRSQTNQKSALRKIIRIEVLIGLFLIAIILGAIFWNQISDGIAQIGEFTSGKSPTTQAPIITSSPTDKFWQTKTITITATSESSPTPTYTQIPPTMTPSPTQTMRPPILALETPIGVNVKFIIHKVNPGESLEAYARDYNTTVAAIRAVNHNLPSFLPLEWTVIIPINTSDVRGFPPFEPYEVRQIVTVEVLADLLLVDSSDLRKYNQIPRGYTLSPGEWIMVPREPLIP